jgi:hypothetical protein
MYDDDVHVYVYVKFISCDVIMKTKNVQSFIINVYDDAKFDVNTLYDFCALHNNHDVRVYDAKNVTFNDIRNVDDDCDVTLFVVYD